MAKDAKSSAYKVVAVNRRARFDYEILETMEVGIVLTGSEVKAVRLGKVSINESHAGEMGDEIFLFNANISEYSHANQFNHEPTRPRKLLLHRRQLNKWLGGMRRKGLTLVPLQLYFNVRGRLKVELALARGKKTVDKRQTIKERDWNRQKQRVMKG